MILRRLSKHVKDQNWIAVALDFLIVVAGILIAFQITGWNETRQDRRDEQRYLAELVRDLEVNVTRVQENKVSTLGRLALAESILAAIDPEYERPRFWPEISQEARVDPGFVPYPYAGLTTSVYLVAADSTFEELIQTGRIGVIRNRRLVSDLTEFYNQLEQYATEDDIVFSQIQPMLGYLRYNGLGLGDRTDFGAVVERARTDPEFLGYVKMAAFISQWQYVNMSRIETRAESLRNAISAEMEARQ
ncbi:MAG: hypothetical protein GC152_04305 [Alphaproteobacteria bacterium]|nr:hypothetical protein [Alphaproteobacteria bacterium]